MVDTGGWYKLCCPSSQLAKPDLLGAIYRVRKHGAQKLPDSAKRSAYARVIKPSLDLTKAWVALKQAAMQRDSKAASVMRELLQEKIAAAATSNESARMARIAAEGLGRLGYRPAVPVLLHATGLTEDAIIEHSLTFALIEIADPALTRAGLKEENARTKRAALIALDQMDGSDLKPSDVIPSLNASDEHLRSAANWVVGHHPDWGGELAGFFRERLAAKNFKNSDRAELEKQLAQLAQDREIQELLGSVLRDPGFADEGWLIVLHAMARAGLKKTPSTWITALWPVVDTDNAVLVKEAVLTARALTLSKTNAMELIGTLSRVAHNAGWPPDVRLDALTALPAGLSSVEPDIFDFLRANLDAKKPPMLRAAAAEIIYRAKLNEEQLIELTDTLKIAGPLELSTLLGAFAHATSEAVGLRLVAALNESKGLAGLRVDLLKPLLEKFPATVQEQGQALLAKLNVDLEKQKAHLEELLASLPKGDIRRGQAIFNSPKTACASCHKIGYVGGLVGPDLTSIGQARTERDLLESVVYPSASFVRSYEPMVVATKSGDEYSGVIKKDAPDEIVLATGPNTEMRIARSDVTEMRPGTVSIMPQGLDEQISRQELADLVAFLKGTKWGAQ
ncbi:MAG: hypothetical protein DME21_14575 [Verrucomicrobia bacterium]|nr:MAG: hypothetical protein DME21_14575 [Verrucomicrobiota bacterium]